MTDGTMDLAPLVALVNALADRSATEMIAHLGYYRPVTLAEHEAEQRTFAQLDDEICRLPEWYRPPPDDPEV